ncbi:MAG: hypothetical protein ABIS30_08400 [Gallionella sp.]
MSGKRTAMFHRRGKQRGAALMVMLVIMILGATVFLVNSLSRAGLRIKQNQKNSQILAQAKETVIGNLIAAQGGQTPGNLLRPDSFAGTESPYNYDGAADSGCLDASKPGSTPVPGLPLISSGTNMRCLGRLPWKDYGSSFNSISDKDYENDTSGIMPWYAVSANLVDPANVIFNSDLLKASPPLHPWLTVRDMNGNVLSSRVAIVIIVPGAALPGQSRPFSPNLPGPNQYLDSIIVPVGCTPPCIAGTYSNYDLDDDFIMGDEHRWVTDPNDPTKQIEDPSYQFNDKLIYITIDELMPLIEKRVANEVKNMLKTYYTAWGAYPFAAPFADPSTSSFTGAIGKFNGLLPRASTTNSFPVWESGSFNISATGGTVSGTMAMKTGTLPNSSWRYESMTITGTPTITITGTLDNIGFGLWPPYDPTTTQVSARVGGTYSTASSVMNNVSVTGVLQADGSAVVTFKGTVKPGYTPDRIRFTDIRPCTYQSTYCLSTSTTWPAWFASNNWDVVMYYAVSPGYAPGGSKTCSPPCLVVNGNGGGNNKQAVVVMTSSALASQAAHPSGSLANYLESENATPADYIYENQTRSATFNDQVIIVAP